MTGSHTNATCWVALEGPCCAGKTTLSRALAGVLADSTACHVVVDYADHVGGGRFLPRPVPESVTEDRQALRTLLAIEADRVTGARASTPEVVLMDRSVHTLLAHRHAIQKLTGLNCFEPAKRVIARSAAAAWPDLVLYLDVTQQAVLDRNRGKFPPDSIFINSGFNAGFREYFDRIADRRDGRIIWLDATLEPENLLKIAEVHARQLLRSRDT